MAPEQIEGKAIDSGTDLFAFGAVLFEVTTGRRAFEGVNQPQVIAAILRSEPSFGDGSLPEPLEHVIRRCLKKSPEVRWQTAADLSEKLRWIQDREHRLDPLRDARRPEQRPGAHAEESQTTILHPVYDGHISIDSAGDGLVDTYSASRDTRCESWTSRSQSKCHGHIPDTV
jgi:serine/threonine protein kinase